MKFATYLYRNQTHIGEVMGAAIYRLATLDPLEHVIRRGVIPTRSSDRLPLDEVTLIRPLRPGKIICIGRNYAAHAAETGSEVPKAPLIFAKFPSAVIGPNETITWDESITKEVDWEGELGVVIGQRARNVSEDDAYQYVFGYTIGNDVSARDLQLRTDGQWTRGKSLDTFCPLGPWIVTPDEVPDPHNLTVKTVVNDDVRQDGHTKDMIFKVPTLIAYCSRMFTLEPGDVILTGTPPGVGEGRDPKLFLKDGDTVAISISGLGELTNPCRVVKAAE
ncbi:MAG: fumarylacetoacetate hydrolase family protein [Anaerolineaceae bacterium]|nr:fumarylacetoacetate hydrolase family protein [Anaerolineaceae bacterium]